VANTNHSDLVGDLVLNADAGGRFLSSLLYSPGVSSPLGRGFRALIACGSTLLSCSDMVVPSFEKVSVYTSSNSNNVNIIYCSFISHGQVIVWKTAVKLASDHAKLNLSDGIGAIRVL